MTMRYPISVALAAVLLAAGVLPAAVHNNTNNHNNNRYRNNYKPEPYPPAVKHDASEKAQQDLTKAIADVSKAEDALNSIVPKLRKEFEASSAWQSAQADLKTAQGEYDAVRTPVLDALRQTLRYMAARDAKDKAEASRNAVINDPATTAEQRTEAATAVLNAGTATTKMETEAMAASPNVTAAHVKLLAANNKVQSLEKEFDASIKSNSDWKTARKGMDDANARLAAAKLALQQAQAKESQAEAQRQDRIKQIDEQNRAHGFPTYNQ